MISDNMLKDALIMAYEQELFDIEKSFSTVKPHIFTDSYETRIKKIGKVVKHKYITLLHVRVRLALVIAAIMTIMIAAT